MKNFLKSLLGLTALSSAVAPSTVIHAEEPKTKNSNSGEFTLPKTKATRKRRKANKIARKQRKQNRKK